MRYRYIFQSSKYFPYIDKKFKKILLKKHFLFICKELLTNWISSTETKTVDFVGGQVNPHN